MSARSATVIAVIMPIELYDYQLDAVSRLKTGSILRGGVGSGKSRTALAYYCTRECGGELTINGKGQTRPFLYPRDLYIITTARKRDTGEWTKECIPFFLSECRELSTSGVKVTVDSWNNISKYCNTIGAFFIFDEQRVVGSGAWVKSFYQICKKNHWILLSATPGDNWMDYIPVFVANGFYKNRTQFIREHVIFNNFTKYPKVEGYLNTQKLVNYKQMITVDMDYRRPNERHEKTIVVGYDKDKYFDIFERRWNPYTDEPIKGISECCHVLRRITNESEARIERVREEIRACSKLIVFYNFDYELEILRRLAKEEDVYFAEWNGHKHMPIPTCGRWLYLVQYTAGAEGWNCIETNQVLFYSGNPSYKIMEQAKGRIDRVNTPFRDLYYTRITSPSPRDAAIDKALKTKSNFNEVRSTMREMRLHGWDMDEKTNS